MLTPSREPYPTHHQAIIKEILPPPSADDTQHHTWFISSSVGTLIHAVCSSFFGVEIASPIAKVAPPMTVQTHEVCALSTSLGSMEVNT